MPELTLILGGARSGKSSYALRQALQQTEVGTAPYRVLFIATAQAFDDEMAARIAAHKAERPPDWYTLEAPTQVGAALRACNVYADGIVLDCLTLLTSNVILTLANPEDAAAAQAAMDAEMDALLAAVRENPAAKIWIVSNEVGLGLVPPYPLGRVYRDVLGRVNQRLAQVADHAVFMVAGLPLSLK